MSKVLIFLLLGLVFLLLLRKLIMSITRNIRFQYLLFFLSTILFFLIIFQFRESNFLENKGTYYPPSYDGEKVIPGKILNEKN